MDGARPKSVQYHVFLSHAGEEKETFVRPLYTELARREILSFFDADKVYGLRQGDDVRAHNHQRAQSHRMAALRWHVFINDDTGCCWHRQPRGWWNRRRMLTSGQ